MKFTRKAKGHSVTLTGVVLHLIEAAFLYMTRSLGNVHIQSMGGMKSDNPYFYH